MKNIRHYVQSWTHYTIHITTHITQHTPHITQHTLNKTQHALHNGTKHYTQHATHMATHIAQHTLTYNRQHAFTHVITPSPSHVSTMQLGHSMKYLLPREFTQVSPLVVHSLFALCEFIGSFKHPRRILWFTLEKTLELSHRDIYYSSVISNVYIDAFPHILSWQRQSGDRVMYVTLHKTTSKLSHYVIKS